MTTAIIGTFAFVIVNILTYPFIVQGCVLTSPPILIYANLGSHFSMMGTKYSKSYLSRQLSQGIFQNRNWKLAHQSVRQCFLLPSGQLRAFEKPKKNQNEATVCWITAPVQYDLLSSSREYHKNGTVTGRNHYIYNFGPFLIKKNHDIPMNGGSFPVQQQCLV